MAKIAKVSEVGNALSIDDVLRQSGTDWDVEVVPADIGTVRSGGYRALVRPDIGTALAFVGERFHPNNHRAQLHTLDAMVRQGTIVPTTVSVWDNGAMLAYQFRCPDLDVTIRDRDVVSPLLTLAFAYGSQLADSTFFSDFRWFCKNQLGKVAQLNRDQRVTHRGGIINRFGDLLTDRIKELGGELGERYQGMRRMLNAPLTGKSLASYFGESLGMTQEDIDQAWLGDRDKLTGPAAKIPQVLDCYADDDCGGGQTVWRAYNAVTRYETHHDGRSPETRQRRMLLGSGNAVASRAYELAARLAA